MNSRPAGPVPDAAVLGVLRAGSEFAIIPHRLPDVDALGSAEGLCRILRATGRRAWVHAPDAPEIYAWAISPDVRAGGAPPATATRVAIDTARADRLALSGPVAANIDHHEDNPGFAPANWVAVAPSCSCLLVPLAEALGVRLDPALATALYRGLVGDTECFRVNLDAAAFAWAGWLLGQGADGEGTAECFWRRSAGFWAYLAAALESVFALDTGAGVPLVVLPIPADMPARFHLLPYENGLLPGHVPPPEGGILAILQEGRTNVRFRLRSRGPDVLPLAHALGGGGHPQAAGVMMTGVRLATAEARLREAWAALAG